MFECTIPLYVALPHTLKVNQNCDIKSTIYSAFNVLLMVPNFY